MTFAHVHPQPVRWAWRGRVPHAKITLLEGDKEAGKSTLIAWLVARITVGDLDGDLRGQPASAILISAEDGATDTVRPTLDAQGAVVDRVHYLDHEDARGFSLPQGLERLRGTIIATGAKLIVIDPIASFVDARVILTSDTSVRRALGPLKEIAEETDSAIILLRHLNAQRNAPALRRGLGGAALANLARSVLVLALHPEDAGDQNGRRVLSMTACNLAGKSRNSIEVAVDGNGRVVIGPEITITSDELLARQPRAETRANRLAEAIAFLRHELDGRDVQVADLEALARSIGVSERTLNRARDELGLRARRVGGRWWLSLSWTQDNSPEAPPHADEGSQEPGTGPATASETRAATGTQPVAPASTSTNPMSESPPPPRDDASTRMSLLELDLPSERKDASSAPGTLPSTAPNDSAIPRVPTNDAHPSRARDIPRTSS